MERKDGTHGDIYIVIRSDMAGFVDLVLPEIVHAEIHAIYKK